MKTESQDKFKQARTMLFAGVSLIAAVAVINAGPVTAILVIGVFLTVYGTISAVYHANNN